MKLQYTLITLLFFILILSGCQSEAESVQSNQPPPTLALETATETPLSATETAVATAEPEPVATVTEPVPSDTPVPATAVTADPTAVPPTTPATAPALPVSLTIPKIDISASIESVGNDGNGRMDVPQQVENVAWWNLGPMPGAGGNAVISGHLDTYLQEPAVFWRLRELEPGDTITVRDARGTDHTFEVVNSEVYEHNQVPLDVIFGDAVRIRPNLILITCEGTWDTNARNYDQRFVVYAKLAE